MHTKLVQHSVPTCASRGQALYKPVSGNACTMTDRRCTNGTHVACVGNGFHLLTVLLRLLLLWLLLPLLLGMFAKQPGPALQPARWMPHSATC